EIFLRLGDDLRLARLASNVGNIHFRQDRYREALGMYQEACATLAERGEPRDVAAVLSNIAVCQISLSRFAEALESYRKARDYCQEHGLPLLVAGADYNIAYLHYLQGEFLRAIELYQASREHCRAAGDPYHAALCDLDEAEIYLELNLNPEAARLAQEAAARFLELGMPYERAKATVTHAIAASRRGQNKLARHLLARARRIFAAEKNPLWPALIDLWRAMLLEGENRDREAAAACGRAYRVLAGSVLPGRAILAELLQSRLLLKSDRLEEARAMCDRAHARLEEVGTPWLRFHAWFAKGQVEERSGDHGAAFRAHQAARREIETLRSHLWGDAPRISFLKDKLAVYEHLVDAHLSHRSVTAAEAFQYIQQAKSRSLVDLILRPAYEPPGNRAAADQSEIAETRRILDAQYRLMERLALGAQTAGTHIESLKSSIHVLESRLMRLMGDLPSDRLGERDAGNGSMSVDAIQSAIPAGAILLEYFVAKGTLCVCVVDGSALEIVPLAEVGAIRDRMRLLQFQMRKRMGEPRRPQEAATQTHLRDLYDDLLAPVRDRLERAGHLIVAPHDFLHHVPFHALRSPGDAYLMDEFTISYAPSGTVFALCHARLAGGQSGSLVLGLPDRFAPHIALEARAAAEILPAARLFLGEEATGQVLRTLGPQSRFIHIATHGRFRRDNPLFSAIRLGDSHLTLLDLYHLPLSAELVALSGCSTGLNVVVGGDELLGLMRGLLMAGVQGAIVSLWDVNDVSTAQFMKCFYGHLRDAPHKAAALQSAMRELRKEYPQPYYWAPFVLAGKYV
ncbi:MAG TPA: CHAT domain-containing tetratricopeptide repeat protein, partial [Candidatus Sulfopaludibacter sp.]|nr:CHAT domain-containing tetratricopeptide repeat protein [Candidatus Sulfopaludibacter sp.]